MDQEKEQHNIRVCKTCRQNVEIKKFKSNCESCKIKNKAAYHKVYQPIYQAAHRDEINKYANSYYHNVSRDNAIKNMAEYNKQNNDKINERKRAFYQNNKERIIQERLNYYQNNRERILKEQSKYYFKKKDESINLQVVNCV